jgi:type II secretory pathway pseudopilin PulG
MRAHRSFEGGFTYLGILVAVVVMGVLLTAAARVWTLTEQREREEQLLFAGDAIRIAIASYYAHGHRYPNSLKDLLIDDRSPVPLHHLRRLYLDPMTNGTDWQLVAAPEGGVKGVYSASTLTPIKRQNFSDIDKTFADSDCYCAWKFVYEPRLFRRWGAPGAPGLPGIPGPAPGTPGISPGNSGGSPGAPAPFNPAGPTGQ